VVMRPAAMGMFVQCVGGVGLRCVSGGGECGLGNELLALVARGWVLAGVDATLARTTRKNVCVVFARVESRGDVTPCVVRMGGFHTWIRAVLTEGHGAVLRSLPWNGIKRLSY
jgi:hypothetical protein